MRKLPIGIDDFAELREGGYIYVDKTEQIYDLINTAKFIFLSRPRRFGKSVLTTTLRELFLGNQALFQGLWIADKIEWQPRPVILLNFNDLNYRTRSLAVALTEQMDKLAAGYGLTLKATEYKGKFLELIERLAEQAKVVLLVDEYDKPITDVLEDREQVAEHVETLKNFYAVLKSTEATHIHFGLLTGVSKYGKLSIFSDLNNLLDITTDRHFATLLGYTQAEVETYFADYLEQMLLTYQVTQAELLPQIAFWYDGYSWDGERRVYVPFSTLVFLQQKTFENHWFSTATPTFLIKLLRKRRIPAHRLEATGGGSELLNSADVNNISVLSLLFQTGYLTIKQVQQRLSGVRYRLGYPNYEVRQSFQKYLLADYLETQIDQVSGVILYDLENALRQQDVAAFIKVLQAVFARIPHQLFLAYEAYYHSVVYLVLSLVGFQIVAERSTNLGRIDAVLELDELVYILEFKLTTATIALQQIRDKQYAQSYQDSGKTIILVGIAFDSEQRNIADWESEVIA